MRWKSGPRPEKRNVPSVLYGVSEDFDGVGREAPSVEIIRSQSAGHDVVCVAAFFVVVGDSQAVQG